MCRLSVDVYLPCPEGLCSHNSDLICTSGECTHTHTHSLSEPMPPIIHLNRHLSALHPIHPFSPHFHFLIYPPLYTAEFLPSFSPCFHSYILLKSNWPHLPLPPSPPAHLPSAAVGFGGLLKAETDAKYFGLKLLTADILCWYSISSKLANFMAKSVCNIQTVVQSMQVIGWSGHAVWSGLGFFWHKGAQVMRVRHSAALKRNLAVFDDLRWFNLSVCRSDVEVCSRVCHTGTNILHPNWME